MSELPVAILESGSIGTHSYVVSDVAIPVVIGQKERIISSATKLAMTDPKEHRLHD